MGLHKQLAGPVWPPGVQLGTDGMGRVVPLNAPDPPGRVAQLVRAQHARPAAPNVFHKGDRVKLTDIGRQQYPRASGHGVVAHEPRPGGKTMTILADGCRTPVSWWRAWWEHE